MSSGSSIDSSYINSIIGEGTTFKGDITIEGLLRIDGDYKGSINSTGKILVGRNGRAECNIKAGTVVIGGSVKGNIHASERIAVLSSGLVIGNLKAPRLDIEDNVVFNGKCTITQNEKGTIHRNLLLDNENELKSDISKYDPAQHTKG